MKRVLTYGMFDIIPGHINLLSRAREFGGQLYVGLSTDAFNSMKHKQSVLDFSSKKIILESIRYVDFVFAEERWEQKKKISRNMILIFSLWGGGWAGEFDGLRQYCGVVYLPRTPDVSTTMLKRDCFEAMKP